MVRSDAPSGQLLLVVLSRREQESLKLVCDAKRPKEIAHLMGIALPSARTLIFRLCQGLCLSGQMELALWGRENPGAELGKPGRVGLQRNSKTTNPKAA